MKKSKKNTICIIPARENSKRVKNKNLLKINGKKLCEYPLIAATKSKYTKIIYVTTDCPKIKKISKKYKATIIERPKKLCNSQALGEDVYEHGYFNIKKDLEKKSKKIELVVLLMANSATVTSKMIDKGIKFLRRNKSFDSAVSTSVYNMWSPLRARKLDEKGALKPFVPFKIFGNPKTLNCDRDSQGDVYYADMSVSIVRPKCLENLKSGLLPQKWMGKKIAPIKSDAGFDVDYEWQIPQLQYWLKKNKVK